MCSEEVFTMCKADLPLQSQGPGAAQVTTDHSDLIHAFADLTRADFKPCVTYNEHVRLTQMILEDVPIVWQAWRGTAGRGHAVDLGYDAVTGKLVGIQIWDDVRTRRT
jgi:hypothetical protein